MHKHTITSLSLIRSSLLIYFLLFTYNMYSLRAESQDLIRLTPGQQRAIDQYGSLTQVGQKLKELELLLETRELTKDEENYLMMLRHDRNDLISEFIQFTESLEPLRLELNSQESASAIPLSSLLDLQENVDAPLLYLISLEDEVSIVLITESSTPVRLSIPLSQSELRSAIIEFYEALQNKDRNFTKIAYQLYQWIFEPIEYELDSADFEHIVIATPGFDILRNIPLAALHDGESWLVERFQFSYIDAASNDAFEKIENIGFSTQSPRVLAAAASNFYGQSESLPFAQIEAETISTIFPDTTLLLNDVFTLDGFLQLASEHDVVHIASHASFSTENLDQSFILFGNAELISLPDFLDAFHTSNTQLVVLSACGTDVSGLLGFMLQQQGIKSVISTLWSINDYGTSVFMSIFYESLKNGMSKSVALREAQLTLIRKGIESDSSLDNFTFSTTESRDIVGIRPRDNEVFSSADIDVFSLTSTEDLSHPYYWAPFILIGTPH